MAEVVTPRTGRGGANVIEDYLHAGLVDELTISLSPVLFGAEVRLFEDIDLIADATP